MPHHGSFWNSSMLSVCNIQWPLLVLLLAPAIESKIGEPNSPILSSTLTLSTRELGYNPKKARPKKGISECKSLSEQWEEFKETGEWRPCRDTPSDVGVPPTDEKYPLDEDDVEKHVVVSLNVGLQPFVPSVSQVVSLLVTNYLSETTEDFIFHIRNRRLTEPRVLQQEEFDLTWVYTDSRLVLKSELWWWTYNTTYACAWAHNGSAITNDQVLHDIETTLNSLVDDAVRNGSLLKWLIEEVGDNKLLNVTHGAMDDDPKPSTGRHPGQPEMQAPTQSPDLSNAILPRDEDEDEPTYPNPLDPRGWDWRRYLGLGLFVLTVVGTILLTQIAAYRQRRRTAKELWGNLATEEGVDELLKTGWKVKGSQMEVYEKGKMGYRDDDSMLIGGFEQQEVPGIGAEITVTHPSSETTPETPNREK